MIDRVDVHFGVAVLAGARIENGSITTQQRACGVLLDQPGPERDRLLQVPAGRSIIRDFLVDVGIFEIVVRRPPKN
jgi:hypothetical protein